MPDSCSMAAYGEAARWWPARSGTSRLILPGRFAPAGRQGASRPSPPGRPSSATGHRPTVRLPEALLLRVAIVDRLADDQRQSEFLDSLRLGERIRIIDPSVLLGPIGAVRAAGEAVGAG